MRNYIPAFDILRFFAAMLVLVGHTARVLKLRGCDGLMSDSLMYETGKAGVAMFFALSGFLITKLLLQEVAAGTFSLRKFFVHRAARILPLYYVMTFSAFFIAPNFSAFYFEAETEELHSFFWQKLALFIIMMPQFNHLFFNEAIPAAIQFWTIGIEVIFYFIIPFVLQAKRAVQWMIGIFIGFYILRYGVPQLSVVEGLELLSARFSNLIFFTRLDCLMVGALAAFFLHHKLSFIEKIASKDNSQIGLLLIALMFIFHRRFINGFDYFMYATAITPFLIFSTQKAVFPKNSWIVKLLAYGGKISYSIYLSHMLVLPVVFWLLYHFTMLSGEAFSLSFFCLAILVVLAVSLATYHFIEQPFRRFIRQKASA